ncbi:ARC1 [Candida oxycetoniae]|uniref:ARC1 n=1 Tax=Candida oxycetoniae TaxID=497107 RepID=A0AAI9WYA8_9ASCO|nr:ARC1 [Candida oxycetoniae]KAI3404834.1 ARC1 [Candida oxycetoniae]
MSDFIQKFEKLSITDIPENLENVKFPELTPEQKALSSQFETLSTRLDEKDTLLQINDSLRTKTFVSGSVPSRADLVLFSKVFPLASKWTDKEEIANFRHIFRWIDLVQNRLVNVSEPLKIDYDIELPREVKEKKKAAPAAAAVDAPAAAAATTTTTKEGKNTPASSAHGPGHTLTEEELKKRAAAKEAKKAAKAKLNAEKQQQQKAASTASAPTPAMVDLRVGFIKKAERHPDADTLYVSTIEMGDEDGPRTVCSGLVNEIPLEEMQQRYVIVVANLKPVTMRGIKSCAMVLCASNADKVEFVNPPKDSKPGDKIFFEGYNGVPEKQLNPKKKIWEAIQPKFTTNENFEVTYTEEGKSPSKLMNEKGELCKNSTIVGAKVN